MFLNPKILFGSMAVVAVFASQITAHAGPAQATTGVNVRSGPGISFRVVDTLAAREQVDVTECNKNTWCYVKHDGADGWVSAKFLSAIRPTNNVQGKNCKFSFKLDNSGPTFSVECDEPEEYGESDDENDTNVFNPQANLKIPTACLYTGIKYTGAEICEGVSTHNNLNGMNDIFASVKLFNGAAIKLCTGSGFSGKCKTYSQSKARLDTDIYKEASSMKIFSQFSSATNQPRLPNEGRAITNRLAGRAVLRRSQRLDLDTGRVGRNGADLQYARAGNGRLYMRAVNGAKMSIGKRDNRGFAGCNVARFNSEQVRQNQMPVGSYICVKTNEGRLAQFRVEQINSGRIIINFETYK